MRFRHADGSTVHLAYCSNVHPAEEVDGLVAQLTRFAAPVRRALGLPRLGVGLWLPAPAANRLVGEAAELARLKQELDRQGLEVVTLNGFPYSGFHQPVVKGAVYRPDWTEAERASYTLTLARILAGLLPDDVAEGSISTLPLAWREPWDGARRRGARHHLREVADGLRSLAQSSGRSIRLAVEPEPGCVVETVDQAVEELVDLDPEWIGLCLDACHLAVGFEDPDAALDTVGRAGLRVFKAQVSAALRAVGPSTPDEAVRLARFVEPRFLHQTRERSGDRVTGTDDLDEALAGGLPGDGEWRVHFHVPVHAPTGTTQPELARFLAALLGTATPATRHLEVETYTWTVLPPGDRPDGEAGLVEGLARELAWTRGELRALGLEEVER